MAAIPLETKYIEKLPEINDALFDSPNFHQNLFNWTLYVDKLESKLSNMAFVFDQYKSACKNHIEAGLKISHAYQNIKELFSLPQDIQISQNLDKFSECLSRIFSYQETLSIQTSNLIVEKLQTIVEEAASLKSLFKNVVTQYHNYQMSMDKAYDCPSYETSVDPSLIDKLSVKSIECKSVYQNDVITYLTLLRSFISNKKLEVVQKLLEFMFVHFSYSNFSKTVLDENDESMSIMFDKISTEMKNNEVISKKDNKSAIELISTIEKNNTDDILQFPLVNEKPSNSNQVNMSVVSTGSQWIRNKVSDYLIYRADRKMFLALNKSLNENEAYRIKTSIQNLGGLDVTSSDSLALFNSSNIGYGNILHLASNCMKLAPNFDFVSREHLNNLTEDYNIIKKGYMRLKLPSNILNQSKYQSLFFGVDASKGLLLAQGIDQSNMVPFVSLNTATVKESFPIETDRNFCFQIITPKGHCILQAFNPRDRNDWILAIQSGIMSSLKHVLLESGSGKTQSIFFNSKSLINNWWMSIEGNHKCADCEAKDPEWASFNIGVVICIECSGVHRSLGVQISKVRSLNLDTWDELMRNSFLSKGNKIVNSFLEADLRGYQKIRSNTNSEERHAFIRLKYVDKMFMKILTPLIQLKLN